jgi:succinate dehydrogenase hydrophobic anchor subunit
MFTAKQITAIFLIFGGLCFILYDIFSLYFFGENTTISYVVNEWLWSNPFAAFVLGFLNGGLIVHFLEWAPTNKHITKKEKDDA